MINILKRLRPLVKPDNIHVDNFVFELHYTVTPLMLLVFSVLLTIKEYFDDPIECDMNDEESIFKTFCWVSYTSVVKHSDKPLPVLLDTSNDLTSRHRQIFHQWVCITFCLQALMFYIPRFLWKSWEDGRLWDLTDDFTGPVPNFNWTYFARDYMAQYLLNEKRSHKIYMMWYCFCEALNFVNVVGQIYFLDWFITGNFVWYGVEYEGANAMEHVFPRMTKCSYINNDWTYSLFYYDALCFLPLNVLNAKFFLILWYWLLILLFLSFFTLIYRALFLFVPKFRFYLFRLQTNLEGKAAQTIVDYIGCGDFFVLYRIGLDINPIIYNDLVWTIHDYIADENSSEELEMFLDDEMAPLNTFHI